MDFALPEGLPEFLERLDAFIAAEIVPLQAAGITVFKSMLTSIELADAKH